MKKLSVIALLTVQATVAGCYGGRILGEGIGDAATTSGGSPADASTVFNNTPQDAAVQISPNPMDAAAPITTEIQAQLTTDWNTTVTNNPSDFTATYGFTFNWPSFYQFPHPTYEGGTQAAYQEFARLLLLFLQDASNFQFLADNHLFDIPLSYAISSPNPQSWTFTQLVNQFSADGAYGNISADVKNGLRDVAAKIAATKGGASA